MNLKLIANGSQITTTTEFPIVLDGNLINIPVNTISSLEIATNKFNILASAVLLGAMSYVPSVTNYVNTKTDGTVFSYEIDYTEVAL